MMEDVLNDFKENSLFRIQESLRMLLICKPRISEDQFWHRPNAATNSIGNILLHLSGNLRQYVISGLGGLPDVRQRDLEFETNLQLEPEKVWNVFEQTVKEVVDTINKASLNGFLEKKTIQGFYLSGLGMVLHAVEHLSYHTGQIAWILKSYQNQDLGFYAGIDLNLKNEEH